MDLAIVVFIAIQGILAIFWDYDNDDNVIPALTVFLGSFVYSIIVFIMLW